MIVLRSRHSSANPIFIKGEWLLNTNWTFGNAFNNFGRDSFCNFICRCLSISSTNTIPWILSFVTPLNRLSPCRNISANMQINASSPVERLKMVGHRSTEPSALTTETLEIPLFLYQWQSAHFHQDILMTKLLLKFAVDFSIFRFPEWGQYFPINYLSSFI